MFDSRACRRNYRLIHQSKRSEENQQHFQTNLGHLELSTLVGYVVATRYE